MRKHRKLLALLVALTFLFSVAAPVMAAPAAEEKAAGTLNALGIIEGYPDGSFGLEKDITRAEFAKIAVVAAGFADAEGLMKNTPSKFSDVATGEWYTGWINLASAQGFVKGDPAGTFRPDAKISYAEVLTVLLRLVGYSDNLPGDWPMNYLTKAVQLGVTKGISFDASAPAVRGSVFALTEKVLDVPMVTWSKDKDVFEVRKDASNNEVKLIANSFKGTMNEGLVTDITWSKGVASLKINQVVPVTTANPAGFTSVIVPVAKSAVISGASDVVALLGSRVDYVVNDDDEVSYLGAKSTKTWQSPSGAAKDNGDGTVVIGAGATMTYDWAASPGVTYFPDRGSHNLTAGISAASPADKIVGVFDKKGTKIEHVFVYQYPATDIINEIVGNTVYPEIGSKYTKGSSDQVIVVRNGEVAPYSSLQEGDLFYLVKAATGNGVETRGLNAFIVASDVVKSGILEGATSTYNKLTISNESYSVKTSDILVSSDRGKIFLSGTSNIDKNMFDKTVEFMLSPVGKVAVLISEVEASTSLYGVVELVEGTSTSLNGVKARILTADGKKVVYDVIGGAATGANGANQLVAGNTDLLVRYYLNSEGKINKVDFASTGSFADAKSGRAQVAGIWYGVANNTAFFGKDGSSKLIGSDWKAFEDLTLPKTVNYFLKEGSLAAVFYNGTVSSTGSDIAVVAGSGRNAKGFYYDLLLKGEAVTYYTDTDSSLTNGSTGSAVTLTLASGKLSALTPASTSVVGEVYGVSGAQINIGATTKGAAGYYYVTKDTVIVEKATSSGSTTVRLGDRIGRDDKVDVYLNSNGVDIDLILIKK